MAQSWFPPVMLPAPPAQLPSTLGLYPAVKLEEGVVEHLVLFSQEAVAAFLLQLSLPLALRDERLHLRAQSHHILLGHRGKRKEGISINPAEWAHTQQGKGQNRSSCLPASQSIRSAGAAWRRQSRVPGIESLYMGF